MYGVLLVEQEDQHLRENFCYEDISHYVKLSTMYELYTNYTKPKMIKPAKGNRK